MDMYQTTKWGEVSEDFLLDKKGKAKICSVILKISFLFAFLGAVCGIVYVLRTTETLSIEFDEGLLFTALLVCIGVFLFLLFLSIILRAAFGVFGLRGALEEAMEQEMERQRQQEKTERRSRKKKTVAEPDMEPDAEEDQGTEEFDQEEDEEDDFIPDDDMENPLMPEEADLQEEVKESSDELDYEAKHVSDENPGDIPVMPGTDHSEVKEPKQNISIPNFPKEPKKVPEEADESMKNVLDRADKESREKPPVLCVVEKSCPGEAFMEEASMLSAFADIGNSMKEQFARIRTLKTENEDLKGEISRLIVALDEEKSVRIETERMLQEALDSLDKLQKVKRFSPGDDEAMHIEFLPDVELISLNMDIRIPTVPKEKTSEEESEKKA